MKIRSPTKRKEHEIKVVLAALWTESLRPVSELGSLSHLLFVGTQVAYKPIVILQLI